MFRRDTHIESRIGWALLLAAIMLNLFGGGRTWAYVAAAVCLAIGAPLFFLGWRKDRRALLLRQAQERETADEHGH